MSKDDVLKLIILDNITFINFLPFQAKKHCHVENGIAHGIIAMSVANWLMVPTLGVFIALVRIARTTR